VLAHTLPKKGTALMIVGVPKEIKAQEFRIALTPDGAAELVKSGHRVLVEVGGGEGAGFTDAEYRNVGAELIESAAEIWSSSEIIVKVKEPQASEYPLMRKGQVLFTYLHLAASKPCTDALLKSGITSIAYETVTENGRLPLLAPMSEVAGRLAPQVGAYALQKASGGRGVLLGGVPGVRPGRVLILGGGVAGTEAARIAHGMGAAVHVIDRNLARLKELDELFGGTIETVYSTSGAIEELAKEADLVIGAVLIKGDKAPKLISNALVAKMKPGSVLVDIAIDQGGCFEDSRATTHSDPTFTIHQSLFYCVANMPGAVPRTSTLALTNATLPYLLQLANKGWKKALSESSALQAGLATHEGNLCSPEVGHALAMPVRGAHEFLT
jgi:alanine dehydrogenase